MQKNINKMETIHTYLAVKNFQLEIACRFIYSNNKALLYFATGPGRQIVTQEGNRCKIHILAIGKTKCDVITDGAMTISMDHEMLYILREYIHVVTKKDVEYVPDPTIPYCCKLHKALQLKCSSFK